MVLRFLIWGFDFKVPWARASELQLCTGGEGGRKPSSKNLLIIELGAGTSVPTVRFFCERSMKEFGCNMVRINPRDYQVPKGATAFACGALEAIEILDLLKLVFKMYSFILF